MFTQKNLCFISGYSEENVLLAKLLIENQNSKVAFWSTSQLVDSKFDYEHLIDVDNDDIFDKAFMFNAFPQDENFVDDFANFLFFGCDFKPDYLIIRGEVTDVWPIVAIQKTLGYDVPVILLLDQLHEIDEFTAEILLHFDVIIGLDKSCDSKDPVEIHSIFKKRNAYIFRHVKGIEDKSVKNVILVDGDADGIQVDGYDLVDVNWLDDEQLFVLLSISKNIINFTGEEEINMLINKIGKNRIFSEEVEGDEKKLSYRENISDFLTRIIKEIDYQLQKKVISVPVAGDTIDFKD